jgi:hypothetical protein
VLWQVNIAVDVERTVMHCFELEGAGNVAELACVFAGGAVVFGRIGFSGGHPHFEQIGAARDIGDVASADIAPLWNGIAVYRDSVLTVLTADASFERDRLYLEKFTVSDKIAQVARTELCRFAPRSASRPLRQFTLLPARILCFASSARNNVTAVACDDGKLRIRSNLTGKKVATIDIEGDYATSVTITPGWGMIVVKTLFAVLVFDVNGFFVRRVANAAEFTIVTAFCTREGFDYIAYQDTDYNCFCFEAAKPEVAVRIEMGTSRLVCIKYDRMNDRLTLVADTGKVLIVSRPHE